MEVSKIFIIVTLVVLNINGYDAGKPCAARQISGESVVCVCNSTYCDTISRRAPEQDTFMSYTSSLKGLRFKKISGPLLSCELQDSCSQVYLIVDPSTKYQTIEGFGGAVTDSAGINWKNLSEPLQQHLIDSYFSDLGIQFSMVRVPVGGCDFSTRPYAYNERPVNDTALSNYSLSYEDYHYKLPLIKAGMTASSTPLHLVATVWSPPPWMKTNNAFVGYSHLKPEYYGTYADYYYKFIEKYAAEGVPIWGITTTNEPTNGVMSVNNINSLGWTANSLGSWIVNNLGPKIRNSIFKDVKIIAGDDQRVSLLYWINEMVKKQPKVLDYIDGVAVHFYTDFITPASFLTETMKSVPGKFLLATEACEGSFPWQRQKVELGSWQRAYNYISDMITDLNHNAIGWIDWNLCLNANGGPNWIHNYVDAPIIVFPEQDEFVKEPMFYALGHFSKFIPRGSRRVRVVERHSIFSSYLEHVAFLTPRSTIVVVFYNNSNERSLHPTSMQVDVLVDYMERNTSLAKGFLRTATGRDNARRQWEQLCLQLNSMGGAIKTWKQWAKDEVENSHVSQHNVTQGIALEAQDDVHLQSQDNTTRSPADRNSAENASQISSEQLVSLGGSVAEIGPGSSISTATIFDYRRQQDIASAEAQVPSTTPTAPSTVPSRPGSRLSPIREISTHRSPTPQFSSEQHTSTTPRRRRRLLLQSPPSQRRTHLRSLSERFLRIEEQRLEIDIRNAQWSRERDQHMIRAFTRMNERLSESLNLLAQVLKRP